MSEENQGEWVEVKDPQSGNMFYAQIPTGECSWDRPPNTTIRERDPEGEWWELFDEKNQITYYYNLQAGRTEWTKPAVGTIIPLAIKNSDIGKEAANAVEAVEKPAAIPPAPPLPPSDEIVLEVMEASGTFEHANLLPGWRQVLDTEVGKNYYINDETGEKTWDRGVATGMQSQPSMKLEPIPDDKRAETLQKAKKEGISGPILNKEAAAAMSHLNPENFENDQLKRIPTLLANEITHFKFEEFSRKHFRTHKRGILRRRVPLEDQMCWTKDIIPAPLMSMSKLNEKEAVNCFKLLQRAMKDKGTLKGSAEENYQSLVEIGVNRAEMRDELFVQLCKQLNKNPNPESVLLGWELMCVYVVSFPPSKNFEQYLASFLRSYPRDDEKVAAFAEHCQKKLEKICRTGARGKVPSVAEIERAKDAPFNPSVFGEPLPEIMRMQKEEDGPIPKILPFLSESILALSGDKSEGIFRVPGDSEMVTELRLRIEKGNYDIGGITDPMVPASLLKLWLRELADPLISLELYPEAIKYAEDPKLAIQVIQKVDALTRKVIFFIVKFLQLIAEPANQPFTKMTVTNLAMVFAPNFLRCPSENPQTIFENAKMEQNFVRTLILNLQPSDDHEVDSTGTEV